MAELSREAVESLTRSIESRFERYLHRTIEDIALEVHPSSSGSKSYAAYIIRRILAQVDDLDRLDATPRIVRVGQDSHPYESTSFPAFRYRALVDESWESSTLRQQIGCMAFVPVIGDHRTMAQRYCRLGRPVVWQPDGAQWDTIRREWQLYRDAIAAGYADRLRKESETDAIHVRPHAQNASDTDVAPGVGPIVKKSFWLNKKFVKSILLSARH